MSDVAKAKAAMTMPLPDTKLDPKDFLSTGVTVLNLACYGRTFGGMCKGFIYRVIGKSQSAKSFLCRTILAEAANNKEFDSYQLIHDDIEHGVHMDTVKFFGQRLANRVSAPAYKLKEPIFSRTIMDFYNRVNAKLKKGDKFIWIVDSQDSLLAEAATKMGDGKAKIHANELRSLIQGIRATGSILILVHHAKVNLGFSWGGDVTTGGASPEFYSSLDIRLSKLGSLKKTIDGRKYPIGNEIQAHVTKNRISGLDRTVRFPLFVDYGIDDMTACVNYLILAGHWSKGSKAIITADEFDFEGPVTKLVKQIESKNQQRELQILTGKIWKKIEDACALKRKARYE